MCKAPMYYFPVPAPYVRYEHWRGHGYNSKNSAFVFPKTQHDKLEWLFYQYIKPLNLNLDDLQEIPCGQCSECRISYSKQWAQRAVIESMRYEHNYFITLTYDDEHLAHTFQHTLSRHKFMKSLGVDRTPGYYPSLIKEDIVNFRKRLSSYMSYHYGIQNLRQMTCGEYGSLNGRPHFHMILFNCPLPDLKVFKDVTLNGKSYSYLVSEDLEDVWGQGFVTVGEVNWNTCAYVARYMQKKLKGFAEGEYQKACAAAQLEPQFAEFKTQSNRPGLAREYFDEHKKEIYQFDKIYLPEGKVVQPSKYYDKLYDIEEPELLALTKEQRRRKLGLLKLQEYKDVKDVEAYERAKHEKFDKQIALLKRTL